MKSYGQMVFEAYARELGRPWPWEALGMPVEVARRKHGPCLEGRFNQASWNRFGEDVAKQIMRASGFISSRVPSIHTGIDEGVELTSEVKTCAYDTDDLAVDPVGETYNISGDGEPEDG